MMDGYGRFYTFFSIQKMGISAEKRQMQIKTAAVSGGFPKIAALFVTGYFSGTGSEALLEEGRRHI